MTKPRTAQRTIESYSHKMMFRGEKLDDPMHTGQSQQPRRFWHLAGRILDRSESAIDVAQRNEDMDGLRRLMETLTYREREVLKLLHGIDDGYAYTLEEVGRIFKVTRERVRQIWLKAIWKCRHQLQKQARY